MQGLNNTNSTGPYPQPPMGLVVLCAIGGIGVLLMAIVGGIYNAIKTSDRNRDTQNDSPVQSRVINANSNTEENSSEDDESVISVPYLPMANSIQQPKSIPNEGTKKNSKMKMKGKKFTFEI